MVVRGHVKNGVVVFDEKVQLQEGQEVSVLVPSPPDENAHSVLDIPTVNLGGRALRQLSPDDDLLEEMLEDRRI